MSDTTDLDRLIDRLAADLRPVRRLPSPGLRALAWLLAVLALALALGAFVNLVPIRERLLNVPDMWLAVLGSALTAGAAALAAFELSLPDRRRAWALLPLPPLVLWVAASGLGCLRNWAAPASHAASLTESRACLIFILAVSVPLSALFVLMLRRACPLRPGLAAAMGGLAAAAAAATLLNFFHPYDATATDLLTHVVAVAIVVAVNRLMGGRLLNAA